MTPQQEHNMVAQVVVLVLQEAVESLYQEQEEAALQLNSRLMMELATAQLETEWSPMDQDVKLPD
jgi:hypothetical protein